MSVEKTKIAVALSYTEGEYAPFIRASSRGELAQKIIDAAKDNDIPIVENETLAQALSLQEIGSYIPEDTFEVMAAIFAFVIENETKR